MVSLSPPGISIVIVTFNSRHLIDRCLAKLGPPDEQIEVVVWDNHSEDSTADYIQQEYGWVELIRCSENLGFARANNAAFGHCRGKYILLLNPDAFLASRSQIFDFASQLDKRPDIAAVGPQLLNVDGSHQVGDCGWETSAFNIMSHALFVHRVFGFLPSIFLSNRRLLSRRFVEVGWLCGACMMVRRDVIDEVGGLDEAIFMYGEDVEWGKRMRSRGYRIGYLPGVHVTHLQGATQRAESEIFQSFGWIERLAVHCRASRSTLLSIAAKYAIVVGFFARFVLYELRSRINYSPRLRAHARNMKAYSTHAAHLQFVGRRQGRGSSRADHTTNYPDGQ